MTTTPASLILLSARFINKYVTTKHDYKFATELYRLIPDLYAVLIAKGAAGPGEILGGFIMKTSIPREPAGPFQGAAQAFVIFNPPLHDIAKNTYRLLPTRLQVSGSDPLSGEEMLRILATQRLKWEQAEGIA
jgi:hypothetical protein